MRIALIGYGEVGRILAEDLRAQSITVSAFDILPAGPMATRLHEHAEGHGVHWCTTPGEAVALADVVICAVTASQAVAAARSASPPMRSQAFFLDINSASPSAKQEAAQLVQAAGARYVEGAVMTSVPPYRLRVPLLLGGPHARALEPILNGWGFAARAHSERLGVASATKMCRSVMIKGLEALVVESLTAARAYDVEDAVLASLHETFPGIDWEKQASYFFQRVIEHGKRRSEEMWEVARTVQDIGLAPLMSEASARRQAAMAQAADAGCFGVRGSPEFARSANWRTEADRLRAFSPPGADKREPG